MTYEATLHWLYALDVRRGMDFRLDRLRPVLTRLGNPERRFPAVHVAGTNGKGSTAAMLHAVYTAAGYRVGLYTSPHLLSFRERIRVGAAMIGEAEVTEGVRAIRAAMSEAEVDLTFFEITTLLALMTFAAADLDVAIVEVGLGGRLDATNVVRTACAVITSVGLDHCAYLGHSLEQIAWEKTGILVPGVPVVTGPLPVEAERIVAREAIRRGSPWIHYGRDFGPYASGAAGGAGLLGAHQRRNAGVAAAVVAQLAERLPVPVEKLEQGVAATRWPGRLERLCESPTIIVDGAHNPEAAACLRAALEVAAPPAPRILLFGAMRDKDWAEMLLWLAPIFDRVILARVEQPRSFDPHAALPVVRDLRGLCEWAVIDSAPEGLRLARDLAGRAGSVVVTGSIFLVAELYTSCGGSENPFADASAD